MIRGAGLTDAVVVDTVRQFELNNGLTRASASSISVSRLAEQEGTLRLPVPEGGCWETNRGCGCGSDFLELPDFFAPFDQIVMCSCFEGEWASSDGFRTRGLARRSAELTMTLPPRGSASVPICSGLAGSWCSRAPLGQLEGQRPLARSPGLVSEKLPYEFAGVAEGNSLCLSFGGLPLLKLAPASQVQGRSRFPARE